MPTDAETLERESAESLRERLLGLVAKVEALGFSREQVLKQSLITPACGLGTRTPDAAQRALELARDLAADLAKVI